MSKFFKKVASYEDLKAQYRELLKVNHPDNGGEVAKMQEINAEYDALFKIWKDRHESETGEKVTETAESTRRHFYTQNGWAGENYNPHLDIAQISKIVRAYIKEKYPTWKFSVRISRFSMGCSMRVECKESPVQIYKTADDLRAEGLTRHIKTVIDWGEHKGEPLEYDEYTDEVREVLNKLHANDYLGDSWTDAEFFAAYEKAVENSKFYAVKTEAFRSVEDDIKSLVNSYRYDDSDGMIDYFDTNFYVTFDFDNAEFVEKTARIKDKADQAPATTEGKNTMKNQKEISEFKFKKASYYICTCNGSGKNAKKRAEKVDGYAFAIDGMDFGVTNKNPDGTRKSLWTVTELSSGVAINVYAEKKNEIKNRIDDIQKAIPQILEWLDKNAKFLRDFENLVKEAKKNDEQGKMDKISEEMKNEEVTADIQNANTTANNELTNEEREEWNELSKRLDVIKSAAHSDTFADLARAYVTGKQAPKKEKTEPKKEEKKEVPKTVNIIGEVSRHNGIAIYYATNCLNNEILAGIKEKADRYIIISPVAYLSDERMEKYKIAFLKIGRDIKREEIGKLSHKEYLKRAEIEPEPGYTGESSDHFTAEEVVRLENGEQIEKVSEHGYHTFYFSTPYRDGARMVFYLSSGRNEGICAGYDAKYCGFIVSGKFYQNSEEIGKEMIADINAEVVRLIPNEETARKNAGELPDYTKKDIVYLLKHDFMSTAQRHFYNDTAPELVLYNPHYKPSESQIIDYMLSPVAVVAESAKNYVETHETEIYKEYIQYNRTAATLSKIKNDTENTDHKNKRIMSAITNQNTVKIILSNGHTVKVAAGAVKRIGFCGYISAWDVSACDRQYLGKDDYKHDKSIYADDIQQITHGRRVLYAS